MLRFTLRMLSLALLFTASYRALTQQKEKEVDWRAPLASGGAPECPAHSGTRYLRSETISVGGGAAVILGSAVRITAGRCAFSAKLRITGDVSRTIELPDPGKQQFSIVDTTKDGKRILLTTDYELDYPNEDLRNVAIAVLEVGGGKPTWVNAWDIFGWGTCGATVEPQGFTPDGRVLILARPSVMGVRRRPNCVSDWGLYAADLVGKVQRLPDDTKVPRFSHVTELASAPCKTDPDIIDACFQVHGRLSAWNGTPTMRIWRIGTNRILGVQDGPLPIELGEKMDWEVQAWGDFEVCPLTRQRPGWMQMVCIESAKHTFFQTEKP